MWKEPLYQYQVLGESPLLGAFTWARKKPMGFWSLSVKRLTVFLLINHAYCLLHLHIECYKNPQNEKSMWYLNSGHKKNGIGDITFFFFACRLNGMGSQGCYSQWEGRKQNESLGNTIRKKGKHEDSYMGPKKGHFSIKESTMWILLHLWDESYLGEGSWRVGFHSLCMYSKD